MCICILKKLSLQKITALKSGHVFMSAKVNAYEDFYNERMCWFSKAVCPQRAFGKPKQIISQII